MKLKTACIGLRRSFAAIYNSSHLGVSCSHFSSQIWTVIDTIMKEMRRGLSIVIDI